MKVAVSATGLGLDAAVDPRFGRCAAFVFVETDGMSFLGEENAKASLGGGAGIQTARLMAEKGVEVVLTGNCGPNAHETLEAAGIGVVVGCEGSVAEVVGRFRAGEYQVASAPNVAPHSGTAGMAR